MNEKLKVLVVADTYFPKVDGTLRFMDEFIKRSRKEYDISLLVPKFKKTDTKKKFHNIKKTHFVDVSRFIHLSEYYSMKWSFKNFKTIKKAIQEADIVFVQGPAMLSYLALYYGKKYNKKMVFYLHVISWELFSKFLPPLINRLFHNIIRRTSISLYNRASAILVPYTNVGDELRAAGVNTPVRVARLGVDIDVFTPAKDKDASKKKVSVDKSKFVVGYVGRVSTEKNVSVLVEGFKKLEGQENLHLLIVGDGPKERIAECKAMKNCTITGFVTDVQKYMKAMDVFVMPSLTETTSLATLEAMSCGLPVIVSKVGFMRKYVVKNENGLFFPKSSPTMLAVKIRKLREEAEFRYKLGEKARKTIAYSFSWERSINKIKRLLNKIYYENI